MSGDSFRIIVVVGVLISLGVSRASKFVGGIVGLLVTTFILIFGLDAYAHHGWIEIFSIRLSQGMFLLAIGAWYFFDIKQILQGREEGRIGRQWREDALSGLRAGAPTRKILSEMAGRLGQVDPSVRTMFDGILAGREYRQLLEEAQAGGMKTADAVLHYARALDVLAGLQDTVVRTAKAAELQPPADLLALRLPGAHVAETKSLSLGSRLNKGDVIVVYDGRPVSGAADLAAAAAQTGSERKVSLDCLFRDPAGKQWSKRTVQVTGGPLPVKLDQG